MAGNRVQDRKLGQLDCMVLGQGPPLVFLPGLAPQNGRPVGLMRTGDIQSMATFAKQFTTYWVGRPSDLATGTSFSEMTATLAEALAGEFTEPVNVLGISTGGSFAQQLAAQHPERVERLVLMSTGCRLGAEGAISQRRMMRLAATRPPRYVLGAMTSELVPAWRGRTAAFAAMYLAGARLYPSARQLADLIVTLAAEDVFDLRTLPTITAPTLIISGLKDRFYEPEIMHETARLIPGSTLSIYPTRGHVTVVSDRQAQAEAIGFLLSGKKPQ
jgi:pimeloyl-ACP methyl ester carboxylesterase